MPSLPQTNSETPDADPEFFPRQLEAVTAPIGPVLVLAGPGAGKTRCLTGRIGHLIARHGVDPGRICAITFTNKAAQEIVSRLRTRHGTLVEELTLGTIHALCMKILRPHARQVGLVAGFGVADDDARNLILKRLGAMPKRRSGLLASFSKRRFGLVTLTGGDEKLYRRYAEELRAGRLIDFDEILILTRKLFDGTGSIAEGIRARWDHVLVDECQDLNPTQYEIISRLAAGLRSLFFVGDDEQSIFSWCGADPRILRTYLSDFAIAAPIMLDRNCRSTKVIFETARRILPPETLFTCREIEASRESPFAVEAVGHADSAAEFRWIVEHLLEDRRTHGCSFGDYAVLFRTHARGQQLETALISAGIPCRLSRGRSMSDNAVVAQVAASLRLIIAPRSELALEGLATLVLTERVVQLVTAGSEADLETTFRRYAADPTKSERTDVRRFLYRADNIRALGKTPLDLGQLLDSILALGIGPRTSPFDDILTRLDDPAANANAVRLHAQLAEASAHCRRAFIRCEHSLGIVLSRMLQDALPRLTVLGPDSTELLQEGEPILDFDFPVYGADDTESVFPSAAQTRITELFAALQIHESRHSEPAFREYVAFDTETTELDSRTCEVIELAAVRVRGGAVVGEFHTLISCIRPIVPKATETHGYTDADLVGQPTLAAVWPAFREFVGDTLLIAHNGYEFDVPVLKRLTAEWDGFAGLAHYDSVPFARHVIREGSLKLVDLAAHFGIPTGRSHRALDDCRCLAAVFERLQEEHVCNARKSAQAQRLDAYSAALALAGPVPVDGIAAELFRKGAVRALGKYSSILELYEREMARLDIAGPPVVELIDRLGGKDLMDRLRADRSAEDWHPAEVEWLRQMVALAESGDLEAGIHQFLDRLALSRGDETDTDSERVSLLTFHATKGLEFSRVYVTGVEDSILPGCRELDQKLDGEICEARRLLYVAMTRAKDRLCLTYSAAQIHRPAGGTLFLSELGLTMPQQHPAKS